MARTRKTPGSPPAASATAETPPAPKPKKRAETPTKYVVQRKFWPEDPALPSPLWHDVLTVDANGAPAAIKAAVGEGEAAVGGVYRAIPARSLEVDVHVEQTIRINFGTNGAGKE